MKSVYLERQHSNSNFNSTLMETSMRRQLIADLLTSSFDFDLLTSTDEWEQLTCDEQMTLADLIDC